MGLFDFLKNNKTDADVARKVIDIKVAGAKTSPVLIICNSIFQASLNLSETTKKEMTILWKSKDFSDTDIQATWFTMLVEFIYFHLNVTNRIAFSKLGDKKRAELVD
jgi:hypothetical protein